MAEASETGLISIRPEDSKELNPPKKAKIDAGDPGPAAPEPAQADGDKFADCQEPAESEFLGHMVHRNVRYSEPEPEPEAGTADKATQTDEQPVFSLGNFQEVCNLGDLKIDLKDLRSAADVLRRSIMTSRKASHGTSTAENGNGSACSQPRIVYMGPGAPPAEDGDAPAPDEPKIVLMGHGADGDPNAKKTSGCCWLCLFLRLFCSMKKRPVELEEDIVK